RWLARDTWFPYVLPLVVYLLVGSLGADRPPGDRPANRAAPDAAAADAPPPKEMAGEDGIRRPRYPLAYALQFFATLAAVVLVWPVYRSVSWRVGAPALAVGVAGGVLWILVCRAGWEERVWAAAGLTDWAASTARPAFNPWAALGDTPLLLGLFLVLRFAGLVLVVPLIEEFFLRGFLMRFVQHAQWWSIPWGRVTWGAAAVATAYGVLAHPAEPIAAALWFSLITALYVRTRQPADCVVAHAVTNAVLGAYVLIWQDWRLW
ncbi:MAG: CAAX prenyl protease-related protein, partial [Pirellulaceae bacterium]|nr:CAAX prenyl protease-related protein [Pirellulaceae bacterium]